MNALFKSAGVLVAAAVAVVAAALPATAAAGSPLSPNNACANPVLAQNATGWAMSLGGNGSRAAVADHTAAGTPSGRHAGDGEPDRHLHPRRAVVEHRVRLRRHDDLAHDDDPTAHYDDTDDRHAAAHHHDHRHDDRDHGTDHHHDHDDHDAAHAATAPPPPPPPTGSR